MVRQIEKISVPLPNESGFDEIIDVRSPSEFRRDHITGALNLPVLSDSERSRIGTRYQRESPFEARKEGAALISTAIAGHLKGHFAEKPRNYRPLLYCWRGGQRSSSLALVLREIGWPVAVLDGGYRAYRRHVIETLICRADELTFRVVNGFTGSGKTLLLHQLRAVGQQVLDLEGLAHHRGSVFGGDLGNPQPSQKRFESLIYDCLLPFDASRPIFVEAESSRIGRLNLPIPLRTRLKKSEVDEIVCPLRTRASHLMAEYRDWLKDPERILATIEHLRHFHSRETVERWKNWAIGGTWLPLIEDLLAQHYDRLYNREKNGHYPAPCRRHELSDHGEESLRRCAAALAARAESTS